MRPFVKSADHVHGKNGLGEIDLPEPKARPVEETASDLIIRMARENPGEITLCPVGPITNVAVALTRAPEIAKLFKEIVVMGSTIFHPGIQGIPTPLADANFWNDPGGGADRAPLRREHHAGRHGRDDAGAADGCDARDDRARWRARRQDADGDLGVLRELLRDDVSGHCWAAGCTIRWRSRSPRTARW